MDPKTYDSGFEEPEVVGKFFGRDSADLVINTDFYQKRLAGLTLAATRVYFGLLCLMAERGLRESFEVTARDISDVCNVSLRGVRNALRKLEEEELIGRMNQKSSNGGDGPSSYVIVSPKNSTSIGCASFAPPLPPHSEKPTGIGVAPNLLSSVSTVSQSDQLVQEDSLGLPCRKIPATEAPDSDCGVAQHTNKDGVNTGYTPEHKKLIARAKMRPNQRLVSCVWEIYDEMEIKRPSASTIGKWRKMYDGKFILQTIDDLAGAGHLEKGLGYTCGALKVKWEKYKTTGNPLDDPLSPARDGIKWGGYRWSSILGTNVEKDFWVPMADVTEDDVATMRLHSISRPEPTPWEAVGNFSEED